MPDVVPGRAAHPPTTPSDRTRREQLASHLSVDDTCIIPLRLTACDLPLRLDARVSLDSRTAFAGRRGRTAARPGARASGGSRTDRVPVSRHAHIWPGRRRGVAPDRGSVEVQATPADGNDVIATTVSQDRCPASGRISDICPNSGHQTRQHGWITWT
jgi:hypothetical protein